MRHIIPLLLCPILLATAEEVKLSPNADKAYTAYTAALGKAYQAETDKVRAALRREQEALTKRGDLDGAMAVKGLLARIDDGQGLDDAKAALKAPLVEDLKADDAAVAKGWASLTIAPSDARVVVAPLRVGVAAVLNTNYVFSAVNVSVPKNTELQTMQIPQFYPGPTVIKALTGGRVYITSSTPMDVLMAQIPKEYKPGVANGAVSAPSITSTVSAILPAGATLTIQGSETRVIAGSLRIAGGAE